MLTHLRPALVLLGLMVALTGLAYPLAMTAIAQAVFPVQANASLIERDGRIVGSSLIGQSFAAPHYFHSRPSAVGFDAGGSGASNLGPTNARLIAEVASRAEAFRESNRVTAVPIDAVTASASGLDPHVSVQNARLQASRVAEARGASVAEVLALLNERTERPWLGIFGTPRVNVLLLNLALDDALPLLPSEAQAAGG